MIYKLKKKDKYKDLRKKGRKKIKITLYLFTEKYFFISDCLFLVK